MFNLFSRQRHGYCDGVSRRSFLQVGAMSLGGVAGSFTFADLLRAEASAGVGSSHKAVINIHLGGGPSHQDMFDLKPNAPVEFRGEFNPIKTNVPGLEICEHFPQLAQMADKFAVIRSLGGSTGQHSNYQTHSGFDSRDLKAVGGRPALGSVVSKIYGPTPSGSPPFISQNGGDPGYLGAPFKAYKPDGSARNNLSLQRDMTADRLDDRTHLLSSIDRVRRDMDRSGNMEAFDSFTQKAVDVVVGGKLADALDTNKENPQIIERYTREGRNFLQARRMIEAGVRVVSFNWGGWDTHSNNFTKLKDQLPKLDTAMSALIEDLELRGMLDDVTIVMWGEFGRSPKINSNGGGRDHWPRLSMAFLAGGGMRLGQAIGTSTRYAEEPKDRPIQFQQVHATMYHNLGINTETAQLYDSAGRPQYLLEHRKPIAELV